MLFFATAPDSEPEESIFLLPLNPLPNNDQKGLVLGLELKSFQSRGEGHTITLVRHFY